MNVVEEQLFEYDVAYYVDNSYGGLDVYYDTTILAHNAAEARKCCAERHNVPKSHILRTRRGASYDCILSARAHGCY